MRCGNAQVRQQNGKDNPETGCWLFFGSCLKYQRWGSLAAHREDTQRSGTKTETELGPTLQTADCSAFDSFLKNDHTEKRQTR